MNCCPKIPYKRILGLWPCIVVLMGLASCSSIDNSSSLEYDGPVNRCESTRDCATGICHTEMKLCYTENGLETEFIARVSAENNPDFPTQLFTVAVPLTEPLVLETQATIAIKDLVPGTRSQVVFSDLSNALPGTQGTQFVYETDYAEAAVDLLPGQYNITIIPKGDSRPLFPVYAFKNVTLQPDGAFWDANRQPVTIALPSDDNAYYKPISGKILYKNKDFTTYGADGLTVAAIDKTTELIVSSIAQSTCTTTNTCGAFKIFVPPAQSDVLLKFSNENEPFSPDYLVDLSNADTLTDLEIEIPAPQVPVLIEAQIVARDEQALAAPPPRCQLLFTLNDDSGSSRLAYWVSTNDNGVAERQPGQEGVYLYPGQYIVTVFPFASRQSDIVQYSTAAYPDVLVVEESQDPLPIDIELTRKVRSTGTISFNDKPIPFATILARNMETVYTESQTATSTDDGTFGTWLDNSVYYAVGQAPAQSNLAFGTSIWNVKQSNDKKFQINLEIPQLITGTIVTPDNSNATTIDWYRTFGQQVYLVGRSNIDTDGTFFALLPP